MKSIITSVVTKNDKIIVTGKKGKCNYSQFYDLKDSTSVLFVKNEKQAVSRFEDYMKTY